MREEVGMSKPKKHDVNKVGMARVTNTGGI